MTPGCFFLSARRDRIGSRRRDFYRGAVQPPSAGPGQTYGPDYWDSIVDKLKSKGGHPADPLGGIKREAYLDLLRRWGGETEKGWILKTDLFEEAMGQDAFLLDLTGGKGSVLGMDLSAAVIQEARRSDSGGRGSYLVADIRRLPFAGHTFDLVISPSTLDHFSDTSGLQVSLRGLRRIIRPGGRLIITLDNRRNLLDPLLRFFVKLGMAPYYIGRSYTVSELRRELAAAGFNVEATTAILHNPRLMAAALASLTGRLDWPPLTRLAHRFLIHSQRLEGTPLKYSTGSFVAALGKVPHEV
jgi:SAM-dependent methyltransferase